MFILLGRSIQTQQSASEYREHPPDV